MIKMQDTDILKKQYHNAQKLGTRISLHDKYSKNKLGFGKWVLGNYRFFNGCKILELGCGNGTMWRGRTSIIQDESLLVLSDFSSGMLEEAKKNVGEYPNIEYKLIDIANIPYKTNEFDFVIANMMLYHVPDLPNAIKEVHRVLNPSGIFYCATFGENGMNRYLNLTLAEQGVKVDIKGSFTLQNGVEILSTEFSSVQRLDYDDGFEITNTNDLVDYIFSLSSIADMNELDRNELLEIFEKQKDENGIIHIPKEYGMFVASNKFIAMQI